MQNSFVMLDETGFFWQREMDSILARSAHIIALHGAGSFNGISVPDADALLQEQLFPRVEHYLTDGRVSVIFDGDNDDPEYPDIGHIMGRLRDHFGDRVDCYAVQVLSWYRYRKELPAMRPLHSALGNEYRTVLFPDKTFPGDHDHFSQNARLVATTHYEQWYVGACGLIASKQLTDYSQKVGDGPAAHRAVVFKLPVSGEQEQKIRRKIADTTDEAQRARLVESLERRQANPYGLLFTPEGEFINKAEYGNVQIEVV